MDKSKILQSAMYHLREQQPFYGTLLQQLTIKYSELVPTGAITFNDKNETYEVLINPTYFCEHLDDDLRVSLLNHEILHFTNKHLFRMNFVHSTQEERTIKNIAGDASINQYLSHVAKGCPQCPHEDEQSFMASKCPGKWVDIAEFKMDDGSPFPTLQSIETYYELLQKEKKKQEGNPQSKGNVKDKLPQFHHGDEHLWDDLDEETKKKMIDEAKKVLRRTIEKTQYGFSSVPGSVRDLLEELEAMSKSIDHKQILRRAIRRNVSVADREGTWKRPNKRYGVVAPGTKLGTLPRLFVPCDTSGSISHKELNEFLSIMYKFLKVGARTCTLGLWHTELYYTQKFKLNMQLDKEVVKSGGTDVSEVLEYVKKNKPDLTLILTDGFLDMPTVTDKSEVIWIVSVGGNKSLAVPAHHKVIWLENLKDA